MKNSTLSSLATNRVSILNSSNELIQLKDSIIDVKDETKKDIRKKIESNEQNNIHFYDIPQFDNPSKKKGKNNFKSRRFPSDLSLIRGTKFYTKPNYNDFEA